ncbi:MAG: replicative DNA helicase [Cyanobacteria bacterium P01_F01_bin.150]
MVQEPSFRAVSDRLPPQNIDAEEAILGGILLDPEAISRVAEILQPEAFYISAHQEIYRAVLILSNQGQPTDLLRTTTWLRDEGVLDKVGGQARLIQLVDRTVSAVNIDQYAKLVMDKYMRRQLISAGTQITQMGFDPKTPLAQLLDQAEQTVFNVTQTRPTKGLTSTADVIMTTFADIEQLSEGLVLPGIPCGFYDLDAMTQGFQRSDLIIAAARPAMGKCLAAQSEIVLADGSVKTIEELYCYKPIKPATDQAGNQGDRNYHTPQLLTLTEEFKLRLTTPSVYVDDGIKPLFQVTTRLGRQIETTLTHPYLTIQGWRSLSELEIGDRIAVPRRIPITGSDTYRECDIKILAYLLGDSCLTHTCPSFTNLNPVIQADFQRSIEQFGNLSIQRDNSNGKRATSFRVSQDKDALAQRRHMAGQDNLTAWLQALDLWGTDSHTKFIPKMVFRLERSQLALFLNRLFATDGWASVLTSGQAQLGYASVSETLARQTQHLLLRFGVIASLKKRSVKYDGHHRIAWQLDITDACSIRNFIDDIGIFGKEEAVLAVESAIAHRKPHTSRDLVPVGIWNHLALAKGNESWTSLAKRVGLEGTSNIHVGKRSLSRDRLMSLAIALDDESLQNLATSDVYWDEIIAIDYVGDGQVYDLTIPDTHNFVANDICVHNTSFVLNIARNIAASSTKLPIAIFSLEMSKEQLVYRLLSSEAQVESGRLRSGRLSQHEWAPLSNAIDSLSQIPIFIDDTANITVNEIRSKCRRLQAEQGGALGLILIDYLQLMEGGGDNRVQELSKMTRALKQLARELNVPIITLSQLSRGVESRTNKRPMMSDLRESGCLTGDTLITLAQTGEQVPISTLAGASDFQIWALNEETFKIETARVSNAFCTGTKPVFRLTTRLGRSIRATANHKFRAFDGWKRLDELNVGDRLALPRKISSEYVQTLSDQELALIAHLIGDGCTLPRHSIQYTSREYDLAQTVVDLATQIFGHALKPRIKAERTWYQVYLPSAQHLTHGIKNPVSSWFQELGIFGLRSHEKFIPNEVFQQPTRAIGVFLRHLWSTDGCIKLVEGKRLRPIAFYASSSRKLAQNVQSLLLRLGINARCKSVGQDDKGRLQHHVIITGKTDLELFINKVGAVGKYKLAALHQIAEYLEQRVANTNRDVIPLQAWKNYVVPSMKAANLNLREVQSAMGQKYCGTSLYTCNLGRERAKKVAKIVNSSKLSQLATSDLYWDTITSIEPDGMEEVFDLTVPEHHNFIANNIVVHNSIEQDADLIMMLYRDEYYNPDTPDRGIAEVIITKHRNGPVGTVKLLFEPQFTRFRNLAQPSGNGQAY